MVCINLIVLNLSALNRFKIVDEFLWITQFVKKHSHQLIIYRIKNPLKIRESINAFRTSLY